MPTKTCIGCGGTWPISFFYIRAKGRKRPRCIGCQPRRTAQNYLIIRKARNSLAKHASKLGLNKTEFSDRFGWNAQRMADDLNHAGSGRCPYCREPNNGWQSLTFDVIDPTKPPQYSSNVRICCLSCNNSKRNMSPEAWSERIDTWNKYREWIDSIQKNPVINLPLFKDM